MRVAGGSAKGKLLLSAKGMGLRPTSARVRGAIFEVLANLAKDWERVLDLYAGTGALGIEALSRGAEWSDFVERDPRNCEIIRKNLTTTGFSDRGKVYCRSLPQALQGLAGCYGIVLMDPPYKMSDVSSTLQGLVDLQLVGANSVIVVEHSNRATISSDVEGLRQVRGYRYGDTSIAIFVPGG